MTAWRNALALGDVVLCNVLNPRENAAATGKPRPAVWVAADPTTGMHFVAGLTSLARFGNGEARTPIDYRAPGYYLQTYLWGGKLVRVTPESVLKRIGELSDWDLDKVLEEYEPDMRRLNVEVPS